ncbi:hypothetical protein TWF281_001302 [Arthrobotrys megalospora]
MRAKFFQGVFLLALAAYNANASALPSENRALQLEKRARCVTKITVTVTDTTTESITTTESYSTTIFATTSLTETTTRTVTSLAVSTYVPPYSPDHYCNNTGVEAALYKFPWATRSTANDITVIKSTTPYAVKQVDAPMVLSGATINTSPHGLAVQTFPGSSSNSYILSIRGYFYATKTAKYNFRIERPDDYVTLWVGSKAYSGWSRSNANAFLSIDNGATQSAGINLDLVAGQYVPIRLVLENSGGAASYMLLVSVDGVYYVHDSIPSAWLVTRPCNLVFGTPFLAWGQET